ncbi:MAG: right-handed parallel beta-helix repeat-containing protein [Bacteroidales bacterium]|nr:right-handed parallel beta-helix repeat-containing protein [Candidatus Physcousia equi]
MKRLFLILAAALMPLMISAQEIRYVKMAKDGGDNAHNGQSWETAKADIQDAINDLANNNISGEVWVMEGTYTPTETAGGNSELYRAFKIPAGITVRGGFKGNEERADQREKKDDNTFGSKDKPGDLDGEAHKGGVYTHKTILSGNLVEGKKASFTWNPTKQRFDTQFYGNSYHVVWFAMNGFTDGRANPLPKPAKLEGCVVEGGHAFNNEVSIDHPHEAYGGGIYMVLNSFVYNCEVRYCDASRDGGGIYQDGGGVVRRTYVHNCQALGLGVEHGYGGGICQEGSNGKVFRNEKHMPVVIAQSAITNCVGRMGGGLAQKMSEEDNSRFTVVANSTLVNNNTAMTEGGGVYTLGGGGIASLSIVNNRCNGSGITLNGMPTGRAGGLYCRDFANVGNNVLWGNQCEANADIQYASTRSSDGYADGLSKKVNFQHNALSKSDNTDWSSSFKMGVVSLDDRNKTEGEKGAHGFPLFENPLVDNNSQTGVAGYAQDYFKKDSEGLETSETDYKWQIWTESALYHSGIQTIDLDVEGRTPAPEISTDMTFGIFNPRCNIGAFVSESIRIQADLATEGQAHFYVDPSYIYTRHEAGMATKGNSWDNPARFLGNVLEYIDEDRAGAKTLGNRAITIHVKEGTVDNTDSKSSGRVRNLSLHLPSNVTLIGSYDATLTGTDLSRRSVVSTPTTINGSLLENFDYAVAHLVVINKKENITMDGFRISYANATSTKLGSVDKDGVDKQSGAALTIVGSTEVKMKNIMVSNCQASRGAAIYADNSTVDFDNCIFHNNTSSTIPSSGIVYSTNGAKLTFDHCDALRNIGHVAYLGSNNTENTWTNSIFYGNMNRPMNNTNADAGGGIDYAVPAFSGATTRATGSHCMFDAKSAQFKDQFGGDDTGSKWQYDLQYTFKGGHEQGYPRFINPTSNSGVSTEGDVTYYGRPISFEPHNSNPIVNAAKAEGDHESWGIDIDGTTRDFGGLPDIGAVENHKNTEPGVENAYADGQPVYGDLYYVRQYASLDEGGDGTSWTHAINGNAYYHEPTGTFLGSHAVGTEQITWTELVEEWTETEGAPANTPTYSSIVSPALMKLKNQSTGKYLKVVDDNVQQVDNFEEGDNFVAVGKNSAADLYSVTARRYINFKDNTTVTLGMSASSNKWTINSSGQIYRNNQKKNRYWMVESATANLTLLDNNTTNAGWKFVAVTLTKTGETPQQKTDYPKGIKGLQYAVNLANKAYQETAVKKQVWVAAGIYAKDPEAGDESCFIIKDGVNVYGAFPKVGNPGMNERQALVSQYVKNNGTYSADDYETILEPTTKTIESGVSRRVLGQPWENNPKSWEKTTNPTNNYKGAEWNGFTLRFGCTDVAGRSSNTSAGRDGGGGACLYNNVKLVDCVVTHNTSVRNDGSSDGNVRAGGVYMDGGTMASCYIINNKLLGMSGGIEANSAAAYGGGAYMYNGTMYNCVVANNRIHGNYADGAGLYFENATFFNNTVVNNKAEGNVSAIGGIALYTNLEKVAGDISLFNIYNSIILNNEGWKEQSGRSFGHHNVGMRTESGKMYLHNCITSDLTNVENIVTPGKKENIIHYDEHCQVLADDQISELLVNVPADYVDPNATSGTFDTWNLRLKPTAAKCINMGEDNPTLYGVTYDLSEYSDMDYAERIQDCRIDIGAYEFNGSMSIAPQVTGDVATYYVTPEGYGSTNADSPANAACASKLQRVIDAAGRYKYTHPTKQVVVKVANSYDLQHAAEPTHFTYYATRTTDYTDDNARVWSIIIPRGVEVWGGYTDKNADGATWTNEKNGFQHRDITAHPTYFDSYYLNKQEHASANTYHVVTFTDRIYDTDGIPYSKDDAAKVATGVMSSAMVDVSGLYEDAFLHMSEKVDGNIITNNDGKPKNFGTESEPRYASNRAVLDGIFVSGGQADAITTGQNTQLNINQYGGAAIVTDYAYVRNCILTNNMARNGGALALTHEALVSGSLIVQNEATNQGGGIYFFEEGKTLSNGIKINSLHTEGEVIDQHMAHVITSTIANNTAKQGGGVWFTNNAEPNARINSCVIWQNVANDQANVYGEFAPEQIDGDQHDSEEFYPFAYTAIQDLRVSGTHNVNMAPTNDRGTRFVDKDYDINSTSPNLDKTAVEAEASDLETKYGEFGYFGLTNYSFLSNAGMPVSYYNMLKQQIAIADEDILGKNRLASTSKIKRDFIEIGARAIDKEIPVKQLMLRLFVAHPDNIDLDQANKMIALKSTAQVGSNEEYYAQEGSSFAFPMQTLQEALDYIKMWRSDPDLINQAHANNLPFEILIARGTYYPKQDLNGNTENAIGATFAIPEGVTIIGGFDAQGGGGTYYGRYFEPDGTKARYMEDGSSIQANVKTVEHAGENIEVGGITFQLWKTKDICDRRALTDINANDIIEPWEFRNQTILSGDASATHALNHGVYHVITLVPDQNAVGYLPKMQKKLSAHDDATCTGYEAHEMGQTVTLNGVIVQGGHAMTYVENALDDYGRYTYYLGGGINVDGNRYCNDYNKPLTNHNPAGDNVRYDQKHRTAYGVGYRDIPLTIVNSRFNNNRAGYGGAITSNGTLYTYSTSFEQNLAMYQNEKNLHYTDENGVEHTDGVAAYPGTGGAIHCTSKLSCINTIFANNEASNSGLDLEPQMHPTFRVPVPDVNTAIRSLRGAGGAIMMGPAGDFHISNCNFVMNKANLFPAIYSLNPTFIPAGQKATITTQEYSQLVNSVGWGNEVTPDMLAKYAGNKNFVFTSKFIVNPGKKNRTRDLSSQSNILATLSQVANSTNWPNQLSDVNEVGTESSLWQDPAVFSAYEEGCGFVTHNEKDARLMTHNSPKGSGGYQIQEYLGGEGHYQNSNLTIASENAVLEGPNFVNPSHKAGVDGYMESADWSPARINNLTDNGSGMISQIITNDGKDYTCSFQTYTEQPDRSKNGFTVEQTGDYKNVGVYTTLHYYAASKDYQLYMPIGNDLYMRSTTESETAHLDNGTEVQRQKNLPRVSYDPNPTHDQTFIDIGVYEYQHVRLNPTGDEVDVLWVSNNEKPEYGPADGSRWEQPTSDMQRAIETLLASRNGKRKEIRVMEGTYTPTYTFTEDDKKFLAFYINTKELNKSTLLAYNGENPELYKGVVSLTIKGGYSKNLKEVYDPKLYPTLIQQQRSENANTDHLFYISDATQRYGYDNTSTDLALRYSADNDWGAWPHSQDGKQAKSLPIEFDGLTLINDKIEQTGTQGAAIHYADFTVADTETDAQLKCPTTATTATITTSYDSDEQKLVTTTRENPAKFILSKCNIVGSGKAGDNTGSAVYLGENGGTSIIYNTVFHSNTGKPIVTKTAATTVNNTFALNGNLADLASGSTMKNSVLWRNNYVVDKYGDQLHIGGSMPTLSGAQTSFLRNAFTGGNTEATNYGGADAADHTIYDNNYNVGLSDNNTDLANGPNFTNPEAIRLLDRSFELKPSLRLLNRGENNHYLSDVTNYSYNASNAIYDLAMNPTLGLDAIGQSRVKATTIDLGAIEYQYELESILYVDPNKTASENANGHDWNTPLGYGSLQDAIDLVAITHQNEPEKTSYVFVKGASSTNQDLKTNETLTLRDGVVIYGSIKSDYTGCYDDKDEGGKYKYSTDGGLTPDMDTYIHEMKKHREGVASNASSKTVVDGIKVSQHSAFKDPALIDGFVVSSSEPANEPVLNVDNKSNEEKTAIVLRNIIVADNDLSSATAGTPVAFINNALLYEALFRDNKTAQNAAVLQLGKTTNTAGYAVNVTVEGKTIGADGTEPIDGGNGANTNIWNSITNTIGTNFDGVEARAISGYYYQIDDPNLNYQLTETSKYIDDEQCVEVASMELPAKFQAYINYDEDRDLLGNPRRLYSVSAADKLDRGAFETWRVDKNFICGVNGTLSENTTLSPDIKQQYFPHDGSVVYVMEQKSLVIDPIDGTDLNPTPENPGFLLLKRGANFYGNGRPVTAAYVAVERHLPAAGAIVSLPYAMNYKTGVATVGATTRNELLLSEENAKELRKYAGTKRADANYLFHPTQSPCWEVVAADEEMAANYGVFYQPHDGAEASALYRFTAKGSRINDFVYTETGNSKTVDLINYDNVLNTGGADDFTDDNDMSWNCIGLPYLVSNYETYQSTDATAHGTAELLMMEHPNTMWLYYDGVQSPNGDQVDGNGGYYSVKSWEGSNDAWHVNDAAAKSIWMGEGIFMQTATLDASEPLTFHRPVAPESFAGVKAQRLVRYYLGATDIEHNIGEASLLRSEFYTTDGIRLAQPRPSSVVIRRDIYSDGSVRTKKMTVK